MVGKELRRFTALFAVQRPPGRVNEESCWNVGGEGVSRMLAAAREPERKSRAISTR